MKRRSRARVVTGLFVPAALLLLAVQGCESPSGDLADAPADEVVVTLPETAMVFPSYIEMPPADAAAFVDLIVIGTVSEDSWTVLGLEPTDAGRQRMYDQGLTEDEVTTLLAYEAEMVYTHHEVQIEGTLKGQRPGDQIEIAVLGGELDGRVVEVSGGVQFEAGKRYVMFLMRDITDAYSPYSAYEIDGATATSVGGCYRGSLPVEDLIAQIDAHKNDTSPYRRDKQ